ncbi:MULTISPECIES: hypothetical protein [unclassified Arcicella]|uniref:hypothetical protein n=1 Tax=unclassified Arcicella TaxID=2644986 RepID=UPI002854DEDD|nr:MULTISPECIES: hypothetical protein [unclassified Arcicella]MDR6564110.1 hypothetical protein [Arcicella sp. BE51]MDR6813863.1 hypothetical protein [Arcicella sp. BE140]MDR6825175.1 hypothetical protein [Arcicella sp. BE139]
MQKLLFIILISITAYTSSFSQAPVVIKQDSSVRDLDEEQDVRDLPFTQRLKFGGGLNGLQFGNPTVIGISPMVGYQATNDFIVGFALDYQYYKQTYYQSLNQYGPRIFGQYRLHFLDNIASNMFAQAEVQKYYYKQAGYSYEYPIQTLAGIGFGFGGFQITALYNLTYDKFNSPYGSPLVLRVGGFFF